MSDYLSRSGSPLTGEQWESVDRAVVEVARRILVGRRFIPLFGPFGPGVQTISNDVYRGVSKGAVDMMGEEESDPISLSERQHMTLPILHKDFRIHWRDLETSLQFNIPLDTSPAAAAAAFCAQTEDNLIFNGNAERGLEGILNATGRTQVRMSDWSKPGKAFEDVLSATQALVQAGFFGPYVLAVSPRLWAQMQRVYENTGVLEIEQVRKLTSDGVFQSPVLPESSAVVIATGPQNIDLAISQDMVTAFLETTKMNHYFRVLEILALRIKRPQAICTIESGKK